jgi:hypothetical protein
MTMTLISTVTVGVSGASVLEFTGIPQTYTDLTLVLSARAGGAGTIREFLFTINNNSSSIYTGKKLMGSGLSTASYSQSGATSLSIGDSQGGASTANTFNNVSLYIPNYALTQNKTISLDSVMETNATTSYIWLNSGLIATTSAVTSLSFSWVGENFVQYSSASLYGILKGSGGATVS